LRELRALAALKGVTSRQIEAARDSESPKPSLIELILSADANADKRQPQHATAGGSSTSAAESQTRLGGLGVTPAEEFWAREISLTFAEQGPLGLVFSASQEMGSPVLLSKVVGGRLASKSQRLTEAIALGKRYHTY